MVLVLLDRSKAAAVEVVDPSKVMDALDDPLLQDCGPIGHRSPPLAGSTELTERKEAADNDDDDQDDDDDDDGKDEGGGDEEEGSI